MTAIGRSTLAGRGLLRKCRVRGPDRAEVGAKAKAKAGAGAGAGAGVAAQPPSR